VESPELRARSGEENQSAAASFPGGALVNSNALALGFESEELTLEINQALAHSWFGVEMYPAPNAAVGIGEGLPNYATIVVDEASGGEPARGRRIRQFLAAYETAVEQYAGTPNSEESIITTMLYDPFPRRRIAAAKAALFFIELEDAYGEAPVRSGLSQVVALLRSKEVGFNDLRAALEQTTGKNLAEPFRVWLYSTGIPQDFRNRYAAEK
jgi:aminopeptidase N